MFQKLVLRRPQGCLVLFLEIIAIIANFKTVIDFMNELSNPTPETFVKSGDMLWSGVILIYGMIGISLIIWIYVSSKALGTFQSMFSAIVLQILGSALFFISYFYRFSINPTVMALFSGVILFIFLPLGAGYVLLVLLLSANN